MKKRFVASRKIKCLLNAIFVEITCWLIRLYKHALKVHNVSLKVWRSTQATCN